MNRLTKAWLALTGKLEPEVREVEKRVEVPVYGDAREVTLYRAMDPRARFGRLGAYPSFADWHNRMFATCEQAFAECPKAEVEREVVWMIAGKYYRRPDLAYITLQPKPKRAKGKRG